VKDTIGGLLIPKLDPRLVFLRVTCTDLILEPIPTTSHSRSAIFHNSLLGAKQAIFFKFALKDVE
jgi:hypothetical protein